MDYESEELGNGKPGWALGKGEKMEGKKRLRGKKLTP